MERKGAARLSAAFHVHSIFWYFDRSVSKDERYFEFFLKNSLCFHFLVDKEGLMG